MSESPLMPRLSKLSSTTGRTPKQTGPDSCPAPQHEAPSAITRRPGGLIRVTDAFATQCGMSPLISE
jgi:hypothetical protein